MKKAVALMLTGLLLSSSFSVSAELFTLSPEATAVPGQLTPIEAVSAEDTGDVLDLPDEPVAGLELMTFGHYEQDNDLSDGAEPIEWYVLKRKTGSALLLSRYALDCRQYNTSYGFCVWDQAAIRKWLNADFKTTAFTKEERAAIKQVTLRNGHSQTYWSVGDSKKTHDSVFLFSYKEAYETYFISTELLRCRPTAYALAQGVLTHGSEGYCWWWCRSPGHRRFEATIVLDDGDFEYSDVDNTSLGVRPLIWVDLTNKVFK